MAHGTKAPRIPRSRLATLLQAASSAVGFAKAVNKFGEDDEDTDDETGLRDFDEIDPKLFDKGRGNHASSTPLEDLEDK